MEASFTQSLLNSTDSCSICVGSGDNYSSVNWRMIGTYDGTYSNDGYSPFEDASYEQSVSEIANVGGYAEFKVSGGHGYSDGDNIVLYGFTSGNYSNEPKLTADKAGTEWFKVKDENDNYIAFDAGNPNDTGYTKIAPAYGEYKTILKIDVPPKPYQDNLILTGAEIDLYNLAQYGDVNVQLLLQDSEVDTTYANTSMYGQTGQWQTSGIGSGDIETGADYGFGSNIYWTGFKKIRLDHIIEEEKIKWNTLKYVVLSLNSSYAFASAPSGTQSIEIEYFYEDPSPSPPAIKIESAGEKTAPSKGIIYQSTKMENDVQGFISAWNTSSPVLSTHNPNTSYPFSDISKGEYKTSQLNGFLATEDTHYLRFFAYDNNSTGSYSTTSNEIKVKRDGINTFTIIDEDQNDGNSVAVAETLFGYIIPDGNKTKIETLYIDWGDGTNTEMDFIYKTASLGGVPNNVITVDNTAPFTVGDYVAVQGSSYIIAKITSLTSTEITLSKDVDGVSPSEVYLLPQHTYTASGTYSAYAQIKNKDNWWSDIEQVGTKPAPPAPNPVANIRASKIVCNVNETIYLNGALSYTNDLNDEILWESGKSVWSAGTGAGETFEDANASNTSVSFSNAGTWTITLEVETDKSGNSNDTETLNIEVVEPDNYNFTGTVTNVTRTPVEKGQLFSKLKEKGFAVKYKKKGGYKYEIRGIVRTVGDKNKLLGLGIRDYETITISLDGRSVVLYPTEKPSVNIPKGANTPDNQPDYGDGNFYTSTTAGFWKFTLTGVELEGV